ncbi:multi-sensor signal transduction histidine kinase [Haloterrigena turkmenica DSM 5511]|uniref:histidine kinase n=1 Tax=Haloterrigena turkmenica (strain ATCC 51198 / DSM 5511 / JCM 9101 / NCIMB 13204 / VKM B-1734 / 4k) TaxID=543526 RepID=D2RY59_HALTV|nr:ATP-binding protein [Haloterrigena turkmenica]ADB61805.1 multi-sensor signal transduction histidine kinase [Haloterrigena turkmenica DSM 5511]
MGSPSSTDPGVQARIRQQEVIAELGQRALETDDLDQLMHDVSVAVAETLDNEYCKVLERLPGGDEVFLRQGVGWRDGLVGTATVSTDLDSQAGYTLLSEEPVIVDDLREEERFSGPELLTNHDVVSGVSVIIGSVEEPWGVLGTHTTDRKEFTTHEANFVQSAANILAAAIERANKEDQLREREAQLSVATDAASIGLWLWDVRENVFTADEFLAEAYGMDPEIVTTGAPIEAFFEPVPETDEDGIWDRLDRALETGVFSAEYRIENGDGDVMWVVSRGEVEYDASGDPVRMHGAVTDITERKRREQQLKEREARYRDLFTSMSEGYCVIERVDTPPAEPIDFRYIEANPAFEEHTGLADVVGKTIRELVPEEQEEWFETYDSVVETGDPVRFERELTTQGRFLECYAFPVGDESDAQVGVLFTDVTERVERERRLEELVERLETSNDRLEQFAYAASHDLQEPLRMVSSYLQLVERRYGDELDAEGREFLQFAVDGADRMREMIDGLLKYSRVETEGDPFEPVDLNAVLEDVLDDLQLRFEESNGEVTTESLPTVEGDSGQLRQIFQNLLDNAIEYSGDGPPRIRVSAERRSGDDAWEISVSDDGIGIDSEYSDQIFDVFQSYHEGEGYNGTGIGLAICERIIERHGGEIRVTSEPGEGSTFTFTLPAASDSD